MGNYHLDDERSVDKMSDSIVWWNFSRKLNWLNAVNVLSKALSSSDDEYRVQISSQVLLPKSEATATKYEHHEPNFTDTGTRASARACSQIFSSSVRRARTFPADALREIIDKPDGEKCK